MTDLSILGSKGESKPHTPVETPDSLINLSYANILDGISEGPIVGLVNGAQSIYLDRTPLANSDGSMNFTGVTWEQRTGEHDQEHIAGFPAVESQHSVGVELKSSQPWAQAFSNLELSAVRIQLAVGALVVTEQDGDRVGYKVAYEIDLSTDDSDYQVVQQGAFDGKTTTGYQRSIRVELPKAERGWRLRVRRTTPDSTTSNIQATTSIGTYTEIIDAKLQYPYTALCGLKIDASQFSAVPERAYRIRGRIIQVPSNYDPAGRTYSGIWDGTFKLAWTDCPPWIWRDIVLNDRYGLGRFIDANQVDKWGLYQIAQYCDALVPDGKGGQEPRFTCNVYLQSRADALTVLQDLASVFRGMSYCAGSEVACAADMPGDPVYTYTNANVIEGKFNRPGSSGSTRFSVAKVAWSDRGNFGNQRVEYVQDQKSLARYGVRETEVTAFGCVSQGQAQRAGQYILLTNRLETGTITFSVGLDGTICRPGDVIRVADEHYAGMPLAGRVKAATATTVTLDNDVTAGAGDTLVVILPKGVAETRIIRSVVDRVVTVTEAFSAVPVKESVYTIETAELVAETYRVLSVNENFGDDKLQYDIVAVARNASKFDAIDNGAQIVIPPTSVLPAAVQAPPTNVELSTFDTLNQGINVATMRITWDAPRGAQSYRVWWKRNNGDWIYAGVTYTAALEVRGIYTGTYTARVAAIGVSGNSSIWALSEPTTLYGKTGEPPAVTFLNTESLLFGIKITWGLPAGAEDTQRTELWYSEGTDLGLATKLADLAYPQNEHVMQGLRAGQRFFFWARLVDRTGNLGPFFPEAPAVVAGMASADAGAILEQIKDQITESELGKELTSRIDLIDKNGPGSVNDRIGTAKTELAQQISEVNNALNTTKGNLQQQITAVSVDVSAAKADLQQQIANVSALAGSLPYRKDKAYSVGQSALGSDGKLYQALKAVPLNTPPPNAIYWTDVGQAVVTANGMAARVQTMETKVETLEGATSAQAQQISGLQSSLTTTNGNVSAAQQAAQDAATLAGGKGKVIVQSAAPAVADRLAQNLWIDTTSNANTPNRWSGSAWVAVTDKVATDAAAAAAGALALAQTKADATVVSSLTTRVSDAEGKLTSQATRMDGMQTSIDGKASSQALQQVTSRVAATEDKNKAQDQLISSQSQALTSLTDSVSKKADASAVQSLGNRVEAAEGALSSQSTDITQLKNSVGAAQPFVAGRAWEFTGSTRGWVATATNGTITAGPLFATVTANPNLQCNFTPVVAGAENPYLRIRLRRRNTSRAGAQMYWANEEGGLAEARRFGWFISTTTTDWQDIELDLSGHAGWNGKKIYAIRLDMMNSGDTSGEIDIAFIAVGRRSASASAEAVSTLNNAVTEAEGKLSSQSQSIVNLQGGLNATNGNVSAAQKAAQDAYSLADAKGKVIVQNSTPSAINQQIQNLWIDTTGGGNTPKRWNGSAWQAVSDKVATDAAAAAANALSQVATKADASTVQSLTNKVEQQGTAITAAGEAITGINASLGQVGGENLLPNPSFEVEGPTAGLADGWRIGSPLSAPNRLLSLVPSTLDPRGKAQRVDAKGLSGSAYVDVALPNASWVSMAPGQVLTVSAYVRGTQDLVSEIYLQYKNSGGATVGTHGPLRTILSDAWNRPVFTGAAAPAGTIGADLLLRVRGPLGGTASDGYYEIDRAQAELSTVVSAWKDNAKNAQSAAQANAAAINSVSGRVSSTEEGLTSVSGRLTQLDNLIGDVGGENLLYNPAFTKLGAATGNNPDGWVPEGTATYTPSMVSSWLNAAENAYRCTTTGVGTTASGNPYTSLVTASERAPAVAPGQTVTSSIYARKTSDSGDLGLRIFHQWANAAGTVISAPASPVVPVSVSGDRVSFTAVAPAGAAKVRVFYRAHAASGSSAAGTFEVARPQVEYGSRPTGWRDNGQVNSTAIGAVSTAVDGLTSSVSQQGKDINSVSSRTTSLENSVNNGSTGLASKASTAALTSVANRVAATESGLTAQSTSITNLEAKIGTALPFVAGQTWEFVNSVEGWIANTSGATLTAGPQYATVAKYTTIQATNTFPIIDGAANPLVRIRLRRRNTGRTSAAMYWANEDGGLAEARRFNWPISTSNGDWQDIEFDLSGHAGWNGKKIWAIRLDMYNSGDANGEVDIAYIAAGRRSVAASGRAFDSLSVNVSQQGDKLAAETQRINGLLSSVGDANAAIQNEAKARSDADGALSQQIQSTQSSLGATNASVQQISTAQTGLNNRVNAQFSIKVAVTQSGVYALGGIGVGIQNQNGVLQSVVAVLADQFAVINAAGNGYVSPFAIQGGQVFMNDAFIRDGSIINAKIANGAITSAKIGVAEIDTLRIRGNAVTVPVSASSPGNVLGAGVGQWQNLVAVGVQMDEGGFITAQYSCYQGFGSGIRKYQFQMDINGLVIAEGGGDWADGFPNLMGSIGVGPGYFVITVKWWGENTGVGVRNHNLFAMGTKR